MGEFISGWLYEKEAEAKRAWTGSPPRFAADAFSDVDISEAAFTWANQIKFWFNQGPVGSCFANAVTTSIQGGISIAVEQGADFNEVQLSRRSVWYFGRVLDGSIGSRGDGGSITNAVRAVHEYGIPLEKDWPYKPDHNWLEQKPPQSVMQDAKAITIKGMVDLQFGDTDGIKKTIKSGQLPVIGIWWPYGWDQGQVNANGIATGIGNGVFGHALVIIGWLTLNGITYWHIVNSHGAIYGTLSTEQRSKLTGYATARPDRCYTFWVPDNYLRTVAGYGNAEMVAPVGVIAPSNAERLSWLL